MELRGIFAIAIQV